MIVYITGPIEGEPGIPDSVELPTADDWEDASEGWLDHTPVSMFFAAKAGCDTGPNIKIVNGDAEAIALMPGWRHSSAVAAELAIANYRGLPIYDALTATPIEMTVAGEMEDAPSGGEEYFTTGSRRNSRSGKGRYDLLQSHAIFRLARVNEIGAEAYRDDHNWRKGQPISRYLDSALRHTFNYAHGYRDEDHIAHAIWNLCCLLETEHMIEKGLLPPSLADVRRWTEGDPTADREVINQRFGDG